MKISINPVLVVPVIGLVIVALALQGITPFRELVDSLDAMTRWIPTQVLIVIGAISLGMLYKEYRKS